MRNKINIIFDEEKSPYSDPVAGLPSITSGQAPMATATDSESKAVRPDLYILNNTQPCNPALENNMNSIPQPFQPTGVLDDIQWMKRVIKIICLIILGLFLLARIEHWDPAAPDVPDLQDEIRGQETGFILPDNTGDNVFIELVALGRHQGPDGEDPQGVGHR
jgi:hypothetical protein